MNFISEGVLLINLTVSVGTVMLSALSERTCVGEVVSTKVKDMIGHWGSDEENFVESKMIIWVPPGVE